LGVLRKQGKAVIYITYYDNPEQASAEGLKMTEKMSSNNSVFIERKYFDLNGKRIYRCFGMGQTHFIFSYHKQLFWISVDTILAKPFLQSYLTNLE